MAPVLFLLFSLNPIQWFRDLYAACEQWVTGPYSLWALFGISFAESSFFPIPPDPLLLLWGVAPSNQADVIWVAVVCGLVSCLGGMFGYLIGYIGGRPLLEWMCTKRWLGWLMNTKRLEMVDGLFKKWGTMAIFIAAMTPIPYKVFTISAGAARMDFRKFVLGSLAGRMPRFIAEGVLLYYFGSWVQEEFKARGEMWFTIVGVLVVVGFLMMGRIKHKPAAVADTGGAEVGGEGATALAADNPPPAPPAV